ncbi:MAG: TatD family hydrolase [Rhodobacteraceae bacterium]|nr:TatD family hydrolase [Paracoccaceae bacterium]
MSSSNAPRPIPDSHCHLDVPQFADDLDDVLADAHAAGVGPLITICTRPGQLTRTRAIAHSHSGVYYAVGVHPHYVTDVRPLTVSGIARLAEDPKMVAIGETGLDYHYTRETRSAQIASLDIHIRASRMTGLPLVIHARDADDDMIEILGNAWRKGPFQCIMHCFSSGQALADLAIACGFFLSFAGMVTFPNAGPLRKIVATVPPEQVLVETDAPYLTPVPHRGQRNAPAYVRHNAEHVAGLLDLPIDTFADIVQANMRRAFPRLNDCVRQ